jgi:hypothetical protein
LALRYGLRKKLKKKEEKRGSMNYTEGTWIENGSKYPKEKKIGSEARESEPLNEEIEEDRSTKKMDCVQISKQKKAPMDALEHLMGKKERQVGKALKTWVKLT